MVNRGSPGCSGTSGRPIRFMVDLAMISTTSMTSRQRTWFAPGLAGRCGALSPNRTTAGLRPSTLMSRRPGWEVGAWSATYTLTATDHVYTGTHAISVTLEPWGGIQFRYPSFDTSPYHFLEFYIRTAAPREQQLWAVFDQDGPDMRARPLDAWGRYVEDCVIEPGVWKRIRIPLWHLDAADRSITAMNIFEGSGQASASFWLDEIRLVGRVQPSGCLPRYGEPQFVLRVLSRRFLRAGVRGGRLQRRRAGRCRHQAFPVRNDDNLSS